MAANANLPQTHVGSKSLPTLYGNEGELENVNLLEPCSLDTPLEEMQRKYWEDGVLWVSLSISV